MRETHRDQAVADCRRRNIDFATYMLAVAGAVVLFLLVEATR